MKCNVCFVSFSSVTVLPCTTTLPSNTQKYDLNSTDSLILQWDFCGHPHASLALALCSLCRKGKSISRKPSPDSTTVPSFMINQGYDNTKNKRITNDRIQFWGYLVTLKQRTIDVLFSNGNYIQNHSLIVKKALIMFPVWPTHAE